MKRNFCVQCFHYTSDGSSELWKQEYFATLQGALKFVEFFSDVYDSIQLFKVK